MTIHLIRHGRTEANLKKLYCGHTDIPLTAYGVEELNRLREAGIYPRSDMFVTSGLRRASQTLEIIYKTPEYCIIKALMEYNFGFFEMKSYEELRGNPDYISWINGGPCPGGESRDGFRERVLTGWEQLVEKAKDGLSTSAVCHGGVIVTIMEELFPGGRDFYEWQPGYGRGYAIWIRENEPPEYTSI